MGFNEKRRRFLRYVYGGIGATALSFIVPACEKGNKGNTEPMYGIIGPPYGTPGPGPAPAYGIPVPYPPQNDVTIYGSVFSNSTKAPIPGIRVSVKDLYSESYTDENGDFVIYVPIQDEYKIKFEDIDGVENGSFRPQKIKITLEDANTPLEIYLLDEEIAGEDAE